MEFSRTSRVSEAMREEISEIIMRLKDPRVELVSVTGVDLSRDLKLASVYVSSIDDKRKDDLLEALSGAKGFVKKEVAKKLHLKHTPDIIFKWDDSVDRAFRISKIINDLACEEERGVE